MTTKLIEARGLKNENYFTRQIRLQQELPVLRVVTWKMIKDALLASGKLDAVKNERRQARVARVNMRKVLHKMDYVSQTRIRPLEVAAKWDTDIEQDAPSGIGPAYTRALVSCMHLFLESYYDGWFPELESRLFGVISEALPTAAEQPEEAEESENEE